MIEHNLLIDKIFEIIFTQRELFKVEIVSTHCISRRLIVREVQLLEVRMLKGLLDGDSFLRVVSEHLFEEVDGVGVGSFENLGEIFWFSFV